MLERLIKWIKKVLHIHSPSEEWGAVEWLEIGKEISAGVHAAFEDAGGDDG